MKDILSYETAVRLKESGFPQPSPEAGQVWHYDRQTSLIITFAYSTGQIDFATIGGITKSLVELPDHCVFAPTATDILRELPPLVFELFYSRRNQDFLVQKRSDDDNPLYCFDSENPAEATAEAWLKLNDKK